MRKVVLICLVFFAASVSAMAQQGSPDVHALQNKLMQEINSNLQCGAQIFTAQTQIQTLTAERDGLIAELAKLKGDSPPSAKK